MRRATSAALQNQTVKLFSAVAGALLAAVPVDLAIGQESLESTSLEEIVVTGSLIKRTEQSSQLVTAISVDEIALRGATNAAEILNAVSQNQPLEVSNSFTGAGTGLASYASLRALGSESTLVLFGGRRVVNNPYLNKAVDLNTVPTALISQVDVLSDGASSIYGSDAIAGVINFITRQEMQGLELSANTLQPEDAGGESYSGSMTLGFGSLAENGWNFYVGGTWREREEIRAIDRDFADTYYIPERGVDRTQPQPFPSNVRQTTGPVTLTANPYFPTCAPPTAIPIGTICRYQPGPDIDAQNPEKQISGLAKLTARFGGAHDASLEYFWAKSDVSSEITAQNTSNIDLPPTSPYYPGNGITPAVPGIDSTRPVRLEMRFNPQGLRTSESISETDRLLAELEGELGGWNYEVFALRSTSDVELNAINGIVFTQPLFDGFAGANGAPFLNPFGEQSAAAAQYLRDIQFHGLLQSASGELTMGGFQFSNRLFALPAGSVSAALALEYAMEEVEFRNNPLLLTLPNPGLNGFGAPGQDVKADRDRYSGTFEVIVPIVQRFEADISVRYDHYDDFGTTTNPKLLLTWEAIDGVLNLHGSYNTGFRAPTLFELFRPQTVGFTSTRHNDPILCPGGVVNIAAGGIPVRDCNVQFAGLTGANPDLEPVESEAYTAGLDWNVMDGLAVGLDYWEYEVDKTVGTLQTTTIFNDLGRFGSYIVRCSDAPPELAAQSPPCLAGGSGDPIAYIDQGLANIGMTRTSGIDLSLNWSQTMGPGRLSFDYRGTYVNEYEFQRFAGDPFISKLGAFIDSSPIIRYSHYATVAWDQGPWGAQLQNRYLGGYVDYNNGLGRDRSYQFYNEVDDYPTWNLALSYKHNGTWTVAALVKNVFDEDPPFTNKLAGLSTGYDERFADPTGRAFQLTFSVKFRSVGDLF